MAAASAQETAAAAAASPPSWQRSVIDKIVAVLYEYRVELAASFALFDTDRDGKISSEELRTGLLSLGGLAGVPAITEMQASELMKALDSDGDGSVSYEEFIQGFRLVDAGPPMPPPSSSSAGGGGAPHGSGGERVLTKSKSFALSRSGPGAVEGASTSHGGAVLAPPKEVTRVTRK